MVDKVEINQEQENNPTLEEQAKQQEEKQEAPQQVTSNEERPSWLPDKFSNAEELAKAYGALETKLSQRAEEKPVEEKQEEIPVLQEVTEEEEQPEPTEEVVEEVEENIEDKTPEVELPENIQKVVDFMNETGGSLEDYVRLNADYSTVDDEALLRELSLIHI